MITLDQVRLLDRKVNQAVELIETLKDENSSLKGKLESYQEKIAELEVLLSSLKDDQSEVEQGFHKALQTLSVIEENGTSDAAPAEAPSSPARGEEAGDAEQDSSETEADSEAAAEEDAATEESEENAELDIF